MYDLDILFCHYIFGAVYCEVEVSVLFSKYLCHSTFIKISTEMVEFAHTIVKPYHLPHTSSPVLTQQPLAAFSLPPSPPDTPIQGAQKPSAVHSGHKGNHYATVLNWHKITVMSCSCFGVLVKGLWF